VEREGSAVWRARSAREVAPVTTVRVRGGDWLVAGDATLGMMLCRMDCSFKCDCVIGVVDVRKGRQGEEGQLTREASHSGGKQHAR
jgi:hypothetical protein